MRSSSFLVSSGRIKAAKAAFVDSSQGRRRRSEIIYYDHMKGWTAGTRPAFFCLLAARGTTASMPLLHAAT